TWPFHRQHLVNGGSYLRNYVDYMFGTERGQRIESMELRKAEAYLSQIIQGMWLKLVVEHCRRLQPYNMGLLYWQANDIWPTVSWSTIEYSGRPKVAMTMAQSFYNLSEPTMFFNYSI
ncbi:beta-mannosidase, putative, partial [Perkinsus marinus ATCC 50983]